MAGWKPAPRLAMLGGMMMDHTRLFCDGVSRRDVLRLGTASLFGTALTLPGLLEGRAAAAEKGKTPKDVSLIFLFLHGGLSTIDTFDLKPDAPVEFRGEFKAIPTAVPGVQICEHMPRQAKLFDKLAVVRSLISVEEHSDSLVMTGFTESVNRSAASTIAGSTHHGVERVPEAQRTETGPDQRLRHRAGT